MVIDDTGGPMGIRLIVQAAGESTRVRRTAPALLVPLHSSIVAAAHGSLSETLDTSVWMALPKDSSVVLTAKSVVARTLVLTLNDALITRAVRTYDGEIDKKRFNRYLGSVEVLPRTNWVNELCHRYHFERAECRKKDNDATRFLETELAKELYFLCHERASRADRPSLLVGKSTPVQGALRHIEAKLFEADVMKGLEKASGASTSTLLRAFKRELGHSPLDYVRGRRLDEAQLLLKSGRYSVGEVSHRVGYQNLSAFSSAFRARFGAKPSAVRVK